MTPVLTPNRIASLLIWLIKLISFAIIALSTKFVHASSFDLFGVHPEGLAEASARVAAADDGAACFYNPGGLALGMGYHLELSGIGASSLLDTQGNRRALEDPFGVTLTVASDVPLEGPLENRVRLGLAVHALPDRLLRLKTRNQSTPFFPYYDNRTQRMVFIPGLSLRLADGLGLGIAADTLAGIQGPVDVREGQSRTLETRIVQEAGTVVRGILGVRFDPTDRVRLGAVFRQSFGIPLSVTTTADVAGVPLSVDMASAEALFDPLTLVIGGRVDPWERWSFEVDLAYQRWSSWKGPLLQVDATVSALSLESKPPKDLFRDTYGMRGATAWRVDQEPHRQITLHAGAGYETSMVDRNVRQGRSNHVDGAKTILATGASVRFPGVLGRALEIGLGLQAHQVGQFKQEKLACEQVPCPPGTVVGPETSYPYRDINNPGYPTLTGSGWMLAASFGVGVEL